MERIGHLDPQGVERAYVFYRNLYEIFRPPELDSCSRSSKRISMVQGHDTDGDTELNLSEMEVEESPQWRQYLSGLVDALLVLSLFVAIERLVNVPVLQFMARYSAFLSLGLFAFYRLFFLLLTGSWTPGMRLLGTRLLNGYLEKLRWRERISAAFFVLINGTDYYNRNPG